MSHPQTNIIEQFVEHARTLYTLPGVASRVLEICKQPEVDARQLKQCIEHDPALTAKILKVVNSSLFGLQQQVSDLNQALALLGTNSLKMLVLGFSLPVSLFKDIRPDVLTRFWRDSIVRSVTCRQLAEDFWQCSSDEAFIVGLLRGVGQLVLVQQLRDSYLRFLEKSSTEVIGIEEAEMEALGFDHAVLSGRMLRNWEIPESIVRGVALPHDPDRLKRQTDDGAQFAQIVHVATHVCRFFETSNPACLERAFEIASSYRSIRLDELQGSLSKARERFEQTAELFSVDLDLDDDLESIMLEAYAQLSDLASRPEILLHAKPTPEPTLDADLASAVAAFTAPSQAIVKSSVDAAETVNLTPTPAGLPSAASTGMAPTVTTAADLHRVLTRTVNHCRTIRAPVSLVLINIDNCEDLQFLLSPMLFEQLFDSIRTAVEALVEGNCNVIRVEDSRFALVLEDHERSDATELSRRITTGIPLWIDRKNLAQGHPVVLSGGLASLALPPKNFPINQMVDAAERCLFAAQSAGAGITKSIDL